MRQHPPYPLTDFEGLAVSRKEIKRQRNVERTSQVKPGIPRDGKLDRRYDEESRYLQEAGSDEFFVEVIRSRSISDARRLRSFDVPTFSSSYALSCSREMIEYEEACESHFEGEMESRPQEIARTQITQSNPGALTENTSSIKHLRIFWLALRRFITCLDGVLDDTRLPLIINHKKTIVISLILIMTWQFSRFADQCAQFVRNICNI